MCRSNKLASVSISAAETALLFLHMLPMLHMLCLSCDGGYTALFGSITNAGMKELLWGRVRNKQGTIHASVCDSTSLSLAHNNLPNASSLRGNTMEDHLLPIGYIIWLISFVLIAMDFLQMLLIAPWGLTFSLLEIMSLPVSNVHHPILINSEMPEILLYLEANKLGWHRFLDYCSRYETLSETKNFIAYGMKISIYCSGSLSPRIHRGKKKPQMLWVLLQGMKSGVGNPTFL